MVDARCDEETAFSCGSVAGNIAILYIIWASLVIFLCSYYTPSPQNIIDLAPAGTATSSSKELGLTFDSDNNQKLYSRMMGIVGNKIGIEVLAFDVYFYNNAKLAFESGTARPQLAYADSIVRIVSMDKESPVEYNEAKLIASSLQKDHIGKAIALTAIETKISPIQEYAPNSHINISVVGGLMIIPQLDQASKIYIALTSLIAVLALLNWLRSLVKFLMLGPKRYFFEQN